ncbi:hypothetical protein AGMMS50268_24370 [Spirochaetia bacterium]|nr:hypothetical protein AGMMS50268_24370 [Spirochaetia bacterium]
MEFPAVGDKRSAGSGSGLYKVEQMGMCARCLLVENVLLYIRRQFLANLPGLHFEQILAPFPAPVPQFLYTQGRGVP